jgi:hypothetical protein
MADERSVDSGSSREITDPMILERTEAQAFIFGYQAVLQMLTARRDIASRRDFLAALMDGRQSLAVDPSAIDVALAKLDDEGIQVEPRVEQAIRTLRFGEWIYLRDTRYYSVFLDSESDSALAVVGLTDRLRDLFGTSGVYVETGVVEYAGHYVCDGLFRSLAYLGPNYRQSFNESYEAMREAGRFQRRPESRLFE